MAVALALFAGGAAAADNRSAPASGASQKPAVPDTEERLSRLERLLDSQVLVDMVTRLDALQQEIQALRGQIEQQGHTVDGLRRRQRELYLDVDRRLSRMEREGPAGTLGGPATAPPPATAMEAEPVQPQIPAMEPRSPEMVATSRPPVPSATAPVAPVPEGPSPAELAAERDAYQAAFDLLRELRYDQATAAFQSFLERYPNGRYGHIAQYWLGEANYAQRNFEQAIANYQRLINSYPESPKVAEAMLKIGYSRYELGQKEEAGKVLQELERRYPGTTEAGQGQKLLQTIRREMRS